MESSKGAESYGSLTSTSRQRLAANMRYRKWFGDAPGSESKPAAYPAYGVSFGYLDAASILETVLVTSLPDTSPVPVIFYSVVDVSFCSRPNYAAVGTKRSKHF
jgi:hypothetical protein